LAASVVAFADTYFGKYLLVSPAGTYGYPKKRIVWGFYYSLSEDLIHWSERKLIKEVELVWTYRCGDADPVMYPSALTQRARPATSRQRAGARTSTSRGFTTRPAFRPSTAI
jgi:hypothetical protein